jgi:hypothetical protein
MSEQQPRLEVVRFIGVDVSKDKLDVCVMPGGELHDFQNDAQGIEKLVALFKQLQPAAVVLDSKQANASGDFSFLARRSPRALQRLAA